MDSRKLWKLKDDSRPKSAKSPRRKRQAGEIYRLDPTCSVRAKPVPCQNEQTQPAVSSYWKRAKYAMAENINQAAIRSPNSCGFLTLTCGDWKNGKFVKADRDTLNKRFNSLRRHLMSWLGIKNAVLIVEQHKDLAWHMHCFVEVEGDIRRGYDWEAVKNGDYQSANRLLKSQWARLRKSLPLFGFGRHQWEPVKHANRAGNYLSKYVSKSLANPFYEQPCAACLCTGPKSRVVITKRFNRLRYFANWKDRLRPRGWSFWSKGTVTHWLAVEVLRCLTGAPKNEYRLVENEIIPITETNGALRRMWGDSWCWKLWQTFTASIEYGPREFCVSMISQSNYPQEINQNSMAAELLSSKLFCFSNDPEQKQNFPITSWL